MHAPYLQVVTDALVRRPEPGDPSYDQYHREFMEITGSLERKARLVQTRLNQIPGISCNDVLGAMYAFPKVEIPEEAWADCRVSSSDSCYAWPDCRVSSSAGLTLCIIMLLL